MNGSIKHRYAVVAGVLCAGVSVCTLASSIALDAAPAVTAIGLSAFGLVCSCLCFVLPWERVGASLIDYAPAGATLAIAVATTTIDPTYGFYLVLVAACVAYMFSRPQVIALHLALIAGALIAPIVFEPEGTRKAIACALIFGPGVILVTAAAVYMRRSSDARELAYHEFANDALALASRIRSKVGPAGAAPVRAPEWLQAPAPVIPLRTVGIAKVVRTETNGAGRISPRLPMTAIAIAASVIAALATTAAVLRGGGEARVATGTAPTLAREAPTRVVAAEPARAHRHANRRGRDAATPASTEEVASQPPLPLTDPADDGGSNAGGGDGSQPATPAPPTDQQPTVPVRPQTGEPEPEAPTPVQQVGPSGPVDTAMGVVAQTVGPVVPDVKP